MEGGVLSLPLTSQGVNHENVAGGDWGWMMGAVPLTGQGVNHNIVLCEDHRGRGRRGLQGVDGWVRPLPAAESSQTTISWLTPR